MEEDLEALWLPFTHNRLFKKNPRMIVGASGMYYEGRDGSKILDGLSGLWCSNAGHLHPIIVDAVKAQLDKLDYAVSFQVHHPTAFELANKLASLAPRHLNHVFFSNSGSEACDTALKIALNYHRARGDSGRFRLIGRELGYHGAGFGGISVGGIQANRKNFATAILPGVDHLQHTHSLEDMAFSKGQPEWGAHLADDLERLVSLHGASTIAAVIVEPMQGSAGVLVPPQGYLARLREICTKYEILLIFDEVITAFGRLGEWFSAERFGVEPDLLTFAKGVTSGVVPLGGVLVSDTVYETSMQGEEHLIEFPHGYTYSGHPLACAAGLAAIQAYEKESMFENASILEPLLESAVHGLLDEPHVVDIRNIGLAAAVQLAPRKGEPTKRALDVFEHCLSQGVMLRYTGDTIAIGPALVAKEAEIGRIIEVLRSALRAVD